MYTTSYKSQRKIVDLLNDVIKEHPNYQQEMYCELLPEAERHLQCVMYPEDSFCAQAIILWAVFELKHDLSDLMIAGFDAHNIIDSVSDSITDK